MILNMTFEINKDKHTLYEYELNEVEPENIGLFIGRNGINFNNIICNIKHSINGTDISTEMPSDDWDSIDIRLKFIKDDSKVIAKIGCKDEEYDIIKKILDEYVLYFKTLKEKYKLKQKEKKTINYRIGASHTIIPSIIGISGSNIQILKNNISKINGIIKVVYITIKEQDKYIQPVRNIGNLLSSEYIIMNITYEGNCDFEEVHLVVEKYIKKFIQIEELKETKKTKETKETKETEKEDNFWTF